MQKAIQTILRGIGQVMLQNNAATGLFFLLGIFYASWVLAIAAIVGNLVGTATSVLLNYTNEDIENGLFGFNGTLVGIAVCFYFGFGIFSLLLLVVGAVFSTIVMQVVQKRLPAFTAPFVISTWLVMAFAWGTKTIGFTPHPALPQLELNIFSALTKGLSEVMFQDSIVTGILFFIGLYISSRRAALYGLYGSLVGTVIAFALGLPITIINMGLYGYNAVLCAIAIGTSSDKNIFSATLAIGLSVILNYFGNQNFIITLTAPFVLSTWFLMALRFVSKKYYFRSQKTISF